MQGRLALSLPAGGWAQLAVAHIVSIYSLQTPAQVTLLAPSGQLHRLSRYWAAWDRPRPESYRRAWVAAALEP